jgi:hypothetical protein
MISNRDVVATQVFRFLLLITVSWHYEVSERPPLRGADLLLTAFAQYISDVAVHCKKAIEQIDSFLADHQAPLYSCLEEFVLGVTQHTTL